MVDESVCYLDASALVKLVITEAESPALRRFLRGHPQTASSLLSRTEAARALARAGIGAGETLDEVLVTFDLLAVDEPIIREAGRLSPAALRTLDAIHLATALALRPDLDILVTYDQRLAAAATAAGLAVASPR